MNSYTTNYEIVGLTISNVLFVSSAIWVIVFWWRLIKLRIFQEKLPLAGEEFLERSLRIATYFAIIAATVRYSFR